MPVTVDAVQQASCPRYAPHQPERVLVQHNVTAFCYRSPILQHTEKARKDEGWSLVRRQVDDQIVDLGWNCGDGHRQRCVLQRRDCVCFELSKSKDIQ